MNPGTSPNPSTTRQQLARATRYGHQLLRITPAVFVVLAPFFLVQAPVRLVTQQCEAPQTKRAGAIGITLWVALVAIISVTGGVV